MNLHEKILNYCFENDGVYRRLKLNTETIDCTDLETEGLSDKLSELFENLIERVQSGRDICYDAYANALMDVYMVTKISPKPVHLFKYATIILEMEFNFPLKMLSSSMIRCLLELMRYEDLISPEDWYDLYENGSSQQKHILVCGVFNTGGFDEDLFYEVCHEVNYHDLFIMMQESKVIPNKVSLEDLQAINASFPDDLQAKIIQECQNRQISKTVVYN